MRSPESPGQGPGCQGLFCSPAFASSPSGPAHRAGLLTQFPCQGKPYLPIRLPTGPQVSPEDHAVLDSHLPQPPSPKPTQLTGPLPSPGSYLLHLLLCVVASRVLDHRVRAGSWGQEQSEQRATPTPAHRAGATVGDSIVLSRPHEGRDLPLQPQPLHRRGEWGVLSEAALRQLRFWGAQGNNAPGSAVPSLLGRPSPSSASLGIPAFLTKETNKHLCKAQWTVPSQQRKEGRKEWMREGAPGEQALVLPPLSQPCIPAHRSPRATHSR